MFKYFLKFTSCEVNSYQGLGFARPQRPVYPGPLGWANQLAQILVQEVRHACSVSVMHAGTAHYSTNDSAWCICPSQRLWLKQCAGDERRIRELSGDTRWQQTYLGNPLSLQICHAQNYMNNGKFPVKSAAAQGSKVFQLLQKTLNLKEHVALDWSTSWSMKSVCNRFF